MNALGSIKFFEKKKIERLYFTLSNRKPYVILIEDYHKTPINQVERLFLRF